MSAPIKFNPDGKVSLTYGECLHPAMKITEPEEARQYLADYTAFIQVALDREPRRDALTAEQIAKINLGYFAGYYDNETRLRVERLFMCSHPVFGPASEGLPTAEEAFAAGVLAATEVRLPPEAASIGAVLDGESLEQGEPG